MTQDMPWFKCNPTEWLQSCADMDSETFGYYARVILFMYQRGGYAPADEGKLRHIWNCSRQRARKVRDDLLADGRIEMEGKNLTQSRVRKELKIASRMHRQEAAEHESSEKPDENPAKTEQKSEKNPAKIGEVFSDNSLKNNETEKQIPDTRYQIPEKKENARAPAQGSLPSDAELDGFLSAYPEAGRVNVARDTVRSMLGGLSVRLGVPVSVITEAARLYAKRIAKHRSQPFSVARWLGQERDLVAELLKDCQPLERPDPAKTEVRQWQSYVGYFKRRDEWLGPGPRPDQPGCLAPADVLAEFGYAPGKPDLRVVGAA